MLIYDYMVKIIMDYSFKNLKYIMKLLQLQLWFL